MEKSIQRRRALKRRDSIPEPERRRWSEEITEQVLQSGWYKQAESVLSYVSFRSEVETMDLNRAVIREGKKLFLPKTYPKEKKMIFYPVCSMDSLQSGYQGILEPQETEGAFEKIANTASVLMIMPGVCFDLLGNRMGYGGGYYDRYLEKFGSRITHTVMLAYQAQEERKIEIGIYDRKPELIIRNPEKEEEWL